MRAMLCSSDMTSLHSLTDTLLQRLEIVRCQQGVENRVLKTEIRMVWQHWFAHNALQYDEVERSILANSTFDNDT